MIAIKTFFLIGFIILLSACSLFQGYEPIDNITIIEQGKNNDDRTGMEEICKGFYISPEKFTEFYKNATLDDETQVNERYKSLPCYSSGEVLLKGEQFMWVIRAGGVGEFYSEDSRFTKVCGIACCKKVSGVC